MSRSTTSARSAALLPAALAIIAALGGCQSTPAAGPPSLRYGRDLCLHCGMVIVDERAAAAFRSDGPAPDQPPVFDDIGCLIDYLAKHNLTPAEIWVKDYGTKEWIPARSATFILADGIETPMGSGLAAYASADSARAATADLKPETLAYDQLPARRLQWRHDRFGTPLK
ncbi:MAG: nitrous oxide reductase accessory protein NosL [Phycisphaerales bacterium]|nr:nitrous oxide reductase accessory protein NosL [Phycisphaerales bacterium]